MYVDDMGMAYTLKGRVSELDATFCQYPLTNTLCDLVQLKGGDLRRSIPGT